MNYHTTMVKPWRDGGESLRLTVNRITETSVWITIGDLTILVRNDDGKGQAHVYHGDDAAPSTTITADAEKLTVSASIPSAATEPDRRVS